MKDAFWLRHDSNAQHDERILELRAEFGWEGYGLFWALVERMRDAQDYRLAMATMGGLATSMGLLKPKLIAIVELCCAHGLFAIDENGAYLYSPSLRRRMGEWDTKKAAFSEAGKRGVAAKQAKKTEATPVDEASKVEATLKPPLSQAEDFPSREEKNREESTGSLRSPDAASAAAPALEIIVDEPKSEITPPESRAIASHTGGPTDVATRKRRPDKLRRFEPPGFENFWHVYPRREKRPNAAHAFAALSEAERLSATAGVAEWFARRSDWVTAKGDFRPHPATWLNEKRWTELADPIPQPANPQAHATHFRSTTAANGVAARLQVQQPDAATGWGYPGGHRATAPAGVAREGVGS